MKAGILPRRLHADLGSVEARSLPRNAALVARKPGFKDYEAIISRVYGHHGIELLSSEERELLEDEINATYRHVMRLKGPKVARSIRQDFSDKPWQVDLVWVPGKVINKLGAENARDAMKMLVGATEPSEALAEQEKTGIMTVRGEAMRAFRDKEIKVSPTKAANVVHGPDKSTIKVAGWFTGFPADLFILSSRKGRAAARAKYRQLVSQTYQKERKPRKG